MLVSGLNYCHHRLRGVLPQLGSNLCLYLIRVLILLFDLLPTVLSLFLAIVVSVVVPVVVFLAPVGVGPVVVFFDLWPLPPFS